MQRPIYSPWPAPSCVPTSSAARSAPPRRRTRWPQGVRAAASTTSSRCRWPTAAKEHSTRCSPRAAARVVLPASPVPSARPSMPSGECCPGGMAVIEMARASGLALVDGRNDPLRASTRGTGELIAAARAQGCRHVVVAVGGSASTDGGLAAVEALGWSLQGLDVTVACDVDTVFTDAARVYGPQKGASDAQIALLDPAPREARRPLPRADGRRRRARSSGSGAAGGLAGGLAAIGAQLAPGFEVIAEAVGLETRVRGRRLSSSPARGSSTRRASRARSSAACSSGPTSSMSRASRSSPGR